MPAMAPAVYFGSLLLIRLLFNDCLYVQADRIAGHKTLPVLLCDRSVRRILSILIAVSFLAALLLIRLRNAPGTYALAAAPMLTVCSYRYLLRRPTWLTLKANILLDISYWITAAGAFLGNRMG